MAQDRLEGVVQAMRPAPGGGLVFYASLPESAAAGSAGAVRQAENRCRLAALLWEHLRAQEPPLWNNHPFSESVERPLQVTHDALGCPRLVREEHAGPSVSFSRAGEEVWAALAGDGSEIGIDVAGSAEFRGGYPVRRAFRAQEIEQVLEHFRKLYGRSAARQRLDLHAENGRFHGGRASSRAVSHDDAGCRTVETALNVADGDVASALALLWSVKEAVAKALGCAFHLADPLDIQVQPSAVEGDWHAFRASLSGKALARFAAEGRQPISVCSVPQADAWLSIAAVRRRPAG